MVTVTALFESKDNKEIEYRGFEVDGEIFKSNNVDADYEDAVDCAGNLGTTQLDESVFELIYKVNHDWRII